MADDIVFKSPTEIANEYLVHLKGLKPEVNTKQTDSDWYVRARVIGGVGSGIYSDQRKIADDPFPQAARREAVRKHLKTYFDRDFNAAQQATGNVSVTGTNGSSVPAGTEFTYSPNGNAYQATSTVTLIGVTGVVPVQSVSAGQSQNLLEGAELTLPSPPAGINSAAVVFGGDISDGKDEETTEEAVASILAFIRNPIAGGKKSDYEQFAQAADPSVNDVNVIRFYRGLGTVGIAITAGTADIDAAIDNGDPVIFTASQALIDSVQEYVDALNPLTDCLSVFGATEVPIDVTVRGRFASGDKDTIPSGQTLTQEQLVIREVKRAIYKHPLGGRKFRDAVSGYMVASEIEEVIDANLSADPYTVGEKAQIIVDRHVLDLAATGINRLVAPTERPIPGVITFIEETY